MIDISFFLSSLPSSYLIIPLILLLIPLILSLTPSYSNLSNPPSPSLTPSHCIKSTSVQFNKHKLCTKCNKYANISNIYKEKTGIDIYSKYGICELCKNTLNLALYESNRLVLSDFGKNLNSKINSGVRRDILGRVVDELEKVSNDLELEGRDFTGNDTGFNREDSFSGISNAFTSALNPTTSKIEFRPAALKVRVKEEATGLEDLLDGFKLDSENKKNQSINGFNWYYLIFGVCIGVACVFLFNSFVWYISSNSIKSVVIGEEVI